MTAPVHPPPLEVLPKNIDMSAERFRWNSLSQMLNSHELSGPLNRLNAILSQSLLHPLDRYRTPLCDRSAIGRPYLALSRIPTEVGVLNRLVLNRLGGSTACYSGATVSKTPLKQVRNKNTTGAAILNRVLDRD